MSDTTLKEETANTNPDAKHVTDHLANDRTYLAWVRTGIAMMGLGVVIAKLRYLMGASAAMSSGVIHASHIGLMFTAIGVITIILAVVIFLQTRREIRQSNYRSHKFYMMALAALTVGLGVAILFYLTQPGVDRPPL